jgi:hypothetical protein
MDPLLIITVYVDRFFIENPNPENSVCRYKFGHGVTDPVSAERATGIATCAE